MQLKNEPKSPGGVDDGEMTGTGDGCLTLGKPFLEYDPTGVRDYAGFWSAHSSVG